MAATFFASNTKIQTLPRSGMSAGSSTAPGGVLVPPDGELLKGRAGTVLCSSLIRCSSPSLRLGSPSLRSKKPSVFQRRLSHFRSGGGLGRAQKTVGASLFGSATVMGISRSTARIPPRTSFGVRPLLVESRTAGE